MSTESTRQELGRRLVAAEVHYCVSALISTLAGREWDGSDGVDPDALATLSYRQPDASDYLDAVPTGERVTVLQVEEEGNRWEWMGPNSDEVYTDDEGTYFDTELEAWESAFDTNGWDRPDGSEVYEHWIVSDWLAGKLAAQGEAVALDIAGLTVWGRATSGQAILLDHVIQKIAVDTYGEPDPRFVADQARMAAIGNLSADDATMIADALDTLDPDSDDANSRRDALERRFRNAIAIETNRD